jgi:hypothetical protein
MSNYQQIKVEVSPLLQNLQPDLYNDLIRVGNNCDGGYILTKSSLINLEYFINFGVGEDFSFEVELFEICNLKYIHSYDHLVSLYYFIKLFLRGVFKFIFKKRSIRSYREDLS